MNKKKPRFVWLQSLVIACSMYSRIPMPQIVWSEEGMQYALCFFPLVGAVIGGLEYLLLQSLGTFGAMPMTCACLGTALPLCVTGGIHMDGFLDTVDARSSCADREKKLEILKDPRAGAFAIVRFGMYLLLYLAAFLELSPKRYVALAGIYVITRAASGWAVVTFPKAKKEGLVSLFAAQARTRVVKLSMAAWLFVGLVWIWTQGELVLALCELLCVVLTLCWYRRMCLREFGGTTGDLAGYFLQMAELFMLIVLVCVR